MSRCHIRRRRIIIQVDEDTLNNFAFVNEGIVTTFLHNGTVQLIEHWCRKRTVHRRFIWQIFAQQNNRFLTENDLFNGPCSINSICCFFTWTLPSSSLRRSSDLIVGYIVMKLLLHIPFVLSWQHWTSVRNWSCRKVLHVQLIIHKVFFFEQRDLLITHSHPL